MIATAEARKTSPAICQGISDPAGLNSVEKSTGSIKSRAIHKETPDRHHEKTRRYRYLNKRLGDLLTSI